MSEQTTETKAELLVDQIADSLSCVYDPAGVLMFWSARIKYLDNRRPCDLWAERDIEGLETLARRVAVLADGAFA